MVDTDMKIAFLLRILSELLREEYEQENMVKDYVEVIETSKFVFAIGKN